MGWKKILPHPQHFPTFGRNPQEAALYRSAASEHRAAAAGLAEAAAVVSHGAAAEAAAAAAVAAEAAEPGLDLGARAAAEIAEAVEMGSWLTFLLLTFLESVEL